jgi:hypothetical protein
MQHMLRPFGHRTMTFWADDLKLSFRRSIRVPNADVAGFEPQDLGAFPLESVSNNETRFPKSMADNRGVFLVMYQREAVRISFESNRHYFIKILLGENNVVSGVPAIETADTILRRQTKLSDVGLRRNLSRKELQDYIVVHRQDSVHKVAPIAGSFRQYLAKPHPSGYTVEASNI